MNTMKRIAYSILASVFVFANANAGELAVTGSAKATYTILSTGSATAGTGDSAGKGLGIANEFTLGASGELDNGWTWSMNQDIDGATVQDDKAITIGMGGMGSFKISISDGGLQKNFSSSQSVYGTPVDTGESGTYTDAADTGTMNTVRYTTPSGLPLDISASVQYAPGTGQNDNASSNSGGTIDASGYDSAIEYAVSASPIEGLGIGASYFNPDDDNGTSQEAEGGAYYATYAMGPVSVGYGQSFMSASLNPADTGQTESHENTQMSIAFNVNDSLSISYEDIESEQGNQTSTSDITMDVTSIQASYTVAGVTLAVSQEEYDNHDYTSGAEMSETNFAMTIAF